MIENYKIDSMSGIFNSSDITNGKYAKIFSIDKSYNCTVIFTLSQFLVPIMSYKRMAFISGGSPNLYDFDISASGLTVKVVDDGANYVIYAKTLSQTGIALKFIQCDTPHLIKTYPYEVPVDITGLTNITNRIGVSKSSIYYTIISLITYSGDFAKIYPTELIIADDNEISGYLYVHGTQLGDGTQICTMPVPLYINTEATMQTFNAQYKGTDNLWYGCTLRLGSDGSLKIYDLGSNAPSNVYIKCNLHYRCSISVINQFLPQ